MNFRHLQKISAPHYYCLVLDKYFPKRWRNILRKLAAFGSLTAFLLSFDALPLYFGRADGVFFLLAAIYLTCFFLETFYRSSLSEGVYSRIQERLLDSNFHLDYSTSMLVFATDDIDISRAIFESRIGLQILAETGLTNFNTSDFIYGGRSPIMAFSLNFPDQVNLVSYLKTVYEADRALQDFLGQRGISQEELLNAAALVMHKHEAERREERFWSRENLGAIPSLGTLWFYEGLGESVYFKPLLPLSLEQADQPLLSLENVLESGHLGQALILSSQVKLVRSLVSALALKIKLGTVLPPLEHKSLLEFNWPALFAHDRDKQKFQEAVVKAFSELPVGHAIVYIEEVVDLLNLLTGEQFLRVCQEHSVQIIGSATPTDAKFFLDNSAIWRNTFSKVFLD